MTRDASHKQLSLNVHLNDDATFDNYFAAEHSSNFLALQSIKSLLSDTPAEPFVYVWGAEGVGVSHLLQAACHAASTNRLRSQYLPLEELAGFAAQELLDGLEQLDLICLDGVQHAVGQPGWDHALFHLFNRVRDNPQCRLIISADCAPRDLGSGLPDLVSRMGWGIVFHLHALSDEDKINALRMRAHARGIELTDDVLAFIIHRASRDMSELFEYLQRLDTLSLAEKRRVTIPFIKEALGW
ncbi:MAG TPA: DnaA regulatory inactivator Hda [Pseudomonadales bacterium]|nr:DnaA regulatory inactivator Hda [Pseudomonadales bacterium]